MRAPSLLLMLVLVSLAGCTPPWTVQHWQVTVEVETPEGVFTGSGVVETRERARNEHIYTLDSAQHQVRGEAIAVDLPQGTLLALVNSGAGFGFDRFNPSDFAWVAGPNGRRRVKIAMQDPPGSESLIAYRANLERGERFRADAAQAIVDGSPFALLEEGWPRFVLFSDPASPTSAVLLAPDQIHEAATGEVRVRRVTIQKTDQPFTRTIDARLPWLRALEVGPISGRNFSRPETDADRVATFELSNLPSRER